MEAVRQHPPVILFLGPADSDKVDMWLESSPYSAHEAADAFQALEQISDFTVRNRPDVIFVHVDSVADEMLFMRNIVASNSTEVPIIDFGSDDKSEEDRLDALAARLFQLIPPHRAV